MSDFETVAATPRPQKPEDDKSKEEEIKPSVEAVDWDQEPPASEPVFAADLGETKLVEPDVIEPIEPVAPVAGEPPKKDNKKLWIIIAIAALLLLCICCVAIIAGVFIYRGDTSTFGMLPRLAGLI